MSRKQDLWRSKDGLLRIEGMARRGLSDQQIFQKMDISRQTFYTWKKKYPEIDMALRSGRAPMEVELENALIKKALGYTQTDQEVIEEMTEKDGVVTKHIKRVTKVYPPDTGAVIFLLKNRMGEYYQDRPKTKIELEQIRLSNEHQQLQNDLLRRMIQDQGNGIDMVEKLIQQIDDEVIEEAEEVLEESE